MLFKQRTCIKYDFFLLYTHEKAFFVSMMYLTSIGQKTINFLSKKRKLSEEHKKLTRKIHVKQIKCIYF